jgi:hypothetical protein
MEICISAMKVNNCQPRLVYSEKVSFLIEREIKTFHNRQKLMEFTTTKPALQKKYRSLTHRRRSKNETGVCKKE